MHTSVWPLSFFNKEDQRVRETQELREGERAENAFYLLQSFVERRTGRVARLAKKHLTPSAAVEFIENLLDWQFSVAFQFSKPLFILFAEYAYGGTEEARAHLNARMLRIERYGHVRR